MPGLEPGIHVFVTPCKKDVDGRDKPGHDESACSGHAVIESIARHQKSNPVTPVDLRKATEIFAPGFFEKPL